ncbi:MAG TPA: hypothetical protein VIQ02_06550 [Jiangellaceae bacterium]
MSADAGTEAGIDASTHSGTAQPLTPHLPVVKIVVQFCGTRLRLGVHHDDLHDRQKALQGRLGGPEQRKH